MLNNIGRYIGFLYQIISNKFGKSKLFSVSLDITDECNLKCVFCGIWKKSEKKILDLDMFENTMKNSKVLRNVRLFNIGGGEPFLDVKLLKNTIEIIEKYAKPLQIRIVTNGTLTQNIVEFFNTIFSNIESTIGLKISIDALEKEYDYLRGVIDGYYKVLKTLEELNRLKSQNIIIKRKLSFSIGFTLTSKNLHQLDSVFALAEKFKIGFFYKPVIRGGRFLNSDMDSALLLNNEKFQDFILNFNKKLRVFLKKRPIFERMTYNMVYKYFDQIISHKNPLLNCGALRNSVYIIPNGDVFACILDSECLGNLRNDKFDKLWTSTKFKSKRSEIHKCSCNLISPCDTIPSLYVEKMRWAF